MRKYLLILAFACLPVQAFASFEALNEWLVDLELTSVSQSSNSSFDLNICNRGYTPAKAGAILVTMTAPGAKTVERSIYPVLPQAGTCRNLRVDQVYDLGTKDGRSVAVTTSIKWDGDRNETYTKNNRYVLAANRTVTLSSYNVNNSTSIAGNLWWNGTNGTIWYTTSGYYNDRYYNNTQYYDNNRYYRNYTDNNSGYYNNGYYYDNGQSSSDNRVGTQWGYYDPCTHAYVDGSSAASVNTRNCSWSDGYSRNLDYGNNDQWNYYHDNPYYYDNRTYYYNQTDNQSGYYDPCTRTYRATPPYTWTDNNCSYNSNYNEDHYRYRDGHGYYYNYSNKRPDLVVDDITLDSNSSIVVRICNKGDDMDSYKIATLRVSAPARAQDVGVSMKLDHGACQDAYVSLSNLNVPYGHGRYAITAEIDSLSSIDEQNEWNNRLSRTLRIDR